MKTLKRKSRSDKFPLTRVMAKLAITSEAVVIVSFLAMNLEKILAGIISFLFLFWRWMLEQVMQGRSGQQKWTSATLWATE
ncbi:MAG: hypothetical protein ABR969_09985 [Sedimentisphaerales bacterium]